MFLTKDEWKIYKRRNIKRLVDYYFIKISNLNKNLYEFLTKHPKIKNIVAQCLLKKYKLEFRLYRKPSVPNLDFMLNSKCTLNCEKCCSLMPMYTKEASFCEDFESFKIHLDNLLKSVHHISRLQILGGEPFLNREIGKMIEYASKKRQIESIVTITNGTIVPEDKILNIYKKYKHKNYVDISDYSEELPGIKTDEVYDAIKNKAIPVFKSSYEWFERGDIYKQNRNIADLKKMMASCWQHNCLVYAMGEFHLCSRSVAIKRILQDFPQDYILVSNQNAAKEIAKMYCKEYIEACDYCHTRNDIKIPRGIQLDKTIKPETLVAVERERE